MGDWASECDWLVRPSGDGGQASSVVPLLVVLLSHCFLASADVRVLARGTMLGRGLVRACVHDVGDVLVVARAACVRLEDVDMVLVAAGANTAGAGRGGWSGVARRYPRRVLGCMGCARHRC